MNEKEIRKLKKKMVRASMIAIVAVVVIVVTAIYSFTLAGQRKEAENVLDVIIREGGTLKESEYDSTKNEESGFFGEWSPTSSAEFPYQTRYFSALINEDGEVKIISMEHIASVSEEEADEMVESISSANTSFGRIKNYYYKSAETDEGTLYVFVDSSEQITFSKRILMSGLLTALAVIFLVYLLLQKVAEKMIAPEVENMERQKEFITNASHDLKTPLAVIRANTEIDIAVNGKNEWNESTLRQTNEMNQLIERLITSAKAGEEAPKRSGNVSISKIAKEECGRFQSLAKQRNISLESMIQEDLTLKGDPSEIRQLISLLMDNAIKYCDYGGEVQFSVSLKGKRIHLLMKNTYRDGGNLDLTRLFDRFYRSDKARSQNEEKQGHGIGLSVAQETAEKYKGTIEVTWKNDIISFATDLGNRKK